jgi:NDP-sugar pyrophosphorylase family protein
MKAMIFAAGLGTRLKPLTDRTPKALVQVAGKSLLEHLILKLITCGINDIIINVHHLAGQVISYLKQRDYFGIRILVSDETGLLLDTGGGIKKASWFFDDGKPFLIHNVDVITNLDISEMVRVHAESKAIATLAVRNRTSGRYLLFDEDHNLCGWKNSKTGEEIIVHQKDKYTNMAFSGVQVVDPGIFNFMGGEGPFSIIKTYLEAAKAYPVKAFTHNDSYWLDVGTTKHLIQAEMDLPNVNFIT